jgi:hypothetical protein
MVCDGSGRHLRRTPWSPGDSISSALVYMWLKNALLQDANLPDQYRLILLHVLCLPSSSCRCENCRKLPRTWKHHQHRLHFRCHPHVAEWTVQLQFVKGRNSFAHQATCLRVRSKETWSSRQRFVWDSSCRSSLAGLTSFSFSSRDGARFALLVAILDSFPVSSRILVKNRLFDFVLASFDSYDVLLSHGTQHSLESRLLPIRHEPYPS